MKIIISWIRYFRVRSCTYIFGQLCSLLVTTVKDLFVVVHPDLRQAHLVTSDHLCTLGKGVGALGAENMTDNGARDDLQLSAALPHLQVNGRQQEQMHNDMPADRPHTAVWIEE